MRKKLPPIEVGQLFVSTDNAKDIWRVAKLLGDQIHVVLVRRDDASRLKTVSIWALANHRLFVPVYETPAREAGD
jgi:hypothetical protein